MEITRVRCVWETRLRAPYFANLKVMRLVLDSVREAVEAVNGALRAYVFLDDRVVLVAEGPAVGLRPALGRARASAEAGFQASDRKPLWGDETEECITQLDRKDAVSPLLRLPVEAGLATEAIDYPWIGGDWVLPRS